MITFDAAHAVHPIPPLYDQRSRILILGSFPSVKSREGRFFYHHPQNRFWKVLAAVMDHAVPETIEEKRIFLLDSHIAVWDVIASCTIEGSSDSSIRDVVPNDLTPILSQDLLQRWNIVSVLQKISGKAAEPSCGPSSIDKPCECRLVFGTSDQGVGYYKELPERK